MRNWNVVGAWTLICEMGLLSGVIIPMTNAQTRPVTARDCVNVKYVAGSDLSGPIVISPDGERVAYELKVPDLTEDRNVFELYVKNLLHTDPSDNGSMIARGENFGGLHWMKDGHTLLMLVKDHDVVAIKSVNVFSKAEMSFFRAPASILEYTMNRDEDLIAYSAVYRNNAPDSPNKPRSASGAFSKLITPNGSFGDPEGVRRTLFISKRGIDGKWSTPQQITIDDPFTHRPLNTFGELQHLSLSPDGRRLAFAYDADTLPENWKNHPYVKFVLGNGAPPIITVMYDLSSNKTTVPIKSIYAGTAPFWSGDSKAFAMTAPAPIDSDWEKRDIQEKRIAGLNANLYWVNVDTGDIQEVLEDVPDHHRSPLAWTTEGDLVLKNYAGTISTFRQQGSSWTRLSSTAIPFKNPFPFSWITSNGRVIVGVYEASTVPPNLYSLDLESGKARFITNLNSQIADASLAKAEQILWHTPDGMEVHGLLFLPTNYIPGHRYPLVIQTKGNQDNSSFVCDSGLNHDPAFAPQPIANSGMMYLIRTFPEKYDQQKEIERRQTSRYPAGIAEAVQQMDIWESGIQSLSAKGMIDPSKVGIIGFSRTGWYVEFMLTQGAFHFSAASVADNAEYSLGEYWLLNNAPTGYDNIYGGSPYGPALENWIKYSISFNLQKIHTPLLAEVMGHGVNNDIPGQIPPLLATKYETLVGMEKLKRPIQLYFFPNQGHMPNSPEARLESLQHNVDWFRFWLQGYEDPDPSKADQYVRWRILRNEQAETQSGK